MKTLAFVPQGCYTGGEVISMRVTRHCGKKGSPNHNDRNFDLEKAKHIDKDKTKDNIYFSYDNSKSFRDGEIAFYKKHYSEELKISNDKKKAQRHPEKVRTLMDVYRSNRTRPDEFILQIGNKNDKVDRNVFLKCVKLFLDELKEWNHSTGDHFHPLNVAGHFDETTPHFHIRGVWDYTDENGIKHINRNKALKLAGIERPEPDKPDGQYNNRKMTFDALMREKWLDICECCGLEIDRKPIPGRRHKDLSEYRKSETAKSYNDIQKFFENSDWKVMSDANNSPSQILQARNNIAESASKLLEKNIPKQKITKKQKQSNQSRSEAPQGR